MKSAEFGKGQDEILVIGSRVRREAFDTIAPIEVFTKEDADLLGADSMASLLQINAVTSGTGQVNESFVGFLSEGGPGASTIGLRGLGARRTLVLLNGRRLAPSGRGPELVAPALNTLPTNILERVEILREGASTIYGSEAIAGVVNISTRMHLNGLTVDGFVAQPLAGEGEVYRVSGVAGASNDRGHIMGSIQYRKRHGLRVRDREDFTCPQDGFVDAVTGAPVGQLVPGSQELRCFPFEGVFNGFAQNYMLGINLTTRATSRFTYDGGDISGITLVDNHDLRPERNAAELDAHVIPPLQSVVAFAEAAYEITPAREFYGEFLYSSRQSENDSVSQIQVLPSELDRTFLGGSFMGFPLSRFGFKTTPFFPNSAAAAGFNDLRFFIVPRVQTSRQDVDFYRGNGGFRGGLGIGDWRFDANLQYSRSRGTYSEEAMDARNLRAAMDVAIAPTGTPDANMVTALAGQAGAGNSYTCASNIGAGSTFIAGSRCVPFNPFDPAVLAGDLPDNVFGYLFAEDTGRTTYQQWIGQLVVDGSIFELPGGDAVVAAGIEYRSDRLNDVPGEARRAGELYGFGAAGITAGSDNVREVFGEMMLPLLSDRSFAEALTLNASARLTDYDSYGSDVTFHLAGEYAPVEALRLRGSYGTSYRAPNLFEQYVAEQIGFAGFDPCNDFGNRSSAGQNLYDNCLGELGGQLNNDLDGDGTPDNWVQTGSAQARRTGGAGNLEAEHSTSWGLGAELQLSAGGVEMSFAADYFNTAVKGEVGTLGSTILDRCYRSGEFRTGDLYCSFVGPRDSGNRGNLTFYNDPYLNIARQSMQGIDLSLLVATGFAGGAFSAKLDATRMLAQKFQPFEELSAHEFNGRLGNHGASGGPKLTSQLDLRFVPKGESWLFNYNIEYTGKMDSTEDLQPDPVPYRGTLVISDLVAEPYWKHRISIRYRWADLATITLGVDNIFDSKPPVIGSHGTGVRDRRPTIGNYFNYSTYDFRGRLAFASVERSF